MFCNEKITNVFLVQNEHLEGADYWLDCFHELAFHTTSGCRIVLETQNFMISLTADGVNCQLKADFSLDENELSESDHQDFKHLLFIGQRLLSVGSLENYYFLTFDDFSLKLIPHCLNDYIPSSIKNSLELYEHMLGFSRYLTTKCPFCGGEGELLIDYVSDYLVRCKNCNRSTPAEIELPHALKNWNAGNLPCILPTIAAK